MSKIAVDTNVLIYLHETSHTFKTELASNILGRSPVISNQVISEYLNVLRRLLKVPKHRLIEHCLIVIEGCEIVPIDKNILSHALRLIQKYDFQVFDSIIIPSALAANCDILYSEDLQHKQLIENRLTIINPFV